MSNTDSTKVSRHWPTMLLGIIVAAIFLVAIFSFQVDSTHVAVVTTFGKINDEVAEAGLHFRWPYPVQRVYKFDNRYRCFSGSVGKLEETLTKDRQNVIVGIFAIYRINDPKTFYRTLVNIPNAEDQLNSWMRSVKNGVIGQFSFSQLINTDVKKMKMAEIEAQILKELREKTAPFGIQIRSTGINSINVPESITEKVFTRMIEERKVIASKFRAEGKSEAEKIKISADREKRIVLSDAEAKAKVIRAEGDAKAADYYAEFSKNPDLAIFLRKLDSLRKIMKNKTTLILDTDSAPFDILKMDAEKLSAKAKK